MTRRFLHLMWLLPAVLAAGCATGGGPAPGKPPARTGAEPTIRVRVLSISGSATIATTGGYRVVGSDGAELFASERGGTLTIQRVSNSLVLRRDATEAGVAAGSEATIEPAGSTSLSVGGVWYPGRIRALVDGSGDLYLINLVGLESYLEGVVPHEIGNPGAEGYAAIEAQAVAARTYALSRMASNAARPFDVEAGVADQVYRGNDGRARLASAAVRDTRGVTLRYGGELCDAYYSATCGGHTSDIRLVWPNRRSAPYLFGELDRAENGGGSFCSAARNFRWRYSFTGHELGRTVRQTLPTVLGVSPASVGDLIDLRILDRSPSGRVQRLEIVTSSGSFTVEGDRIRWAVMLDVARGRILPSTLFDVEKRMADGRIGSVSFVGGGNGHGVGMCQNGAIGMAKLGYSYTMILQHYYPGAEIEAGY